MGFYVHISTVFSGCSEKTPLVAQKHLELQKARYEALPRGADGQIVGDNEWRTVEQFLTAVASGRTINCGPKGELCTWGYVGNYTIVERFVEDLIPFWTDLWESRAGLCEHENIVVFEEPEQRERAIAHVVSYLDKDKPLLIERHDLPFCWGQF